MSQQDLFYQLSQVPLSSSESSIHNELAIVATERVSPVVSQVLYPIREESYDLASEQD